MRERRSEWELRADIVEVCRRMYQRGYVSAMDGNVSARLGPDRLLATPAGAAKGYLKAEELVVIDGLGRPVAGRGKPSSEIKVHLAAYRVRPEVGAVVHAHPPATVAHSIAGISLAQCIVPESVLTLGAIASAAYAPPGSHTLAEAVEAQLRCFDALVMDRHGSVTLGGDVFEAYYRLEALEHTALTSLYARRLGPVRPLPADEVERLYAIAEAAGVQWKFRSCAGCNVCAAATQSAGAAPSAEDELVARVLQRLADKLAAGR